MFGVTGIRVRDAFFKMSGRHGKAGFREVLMCTLFEHIGLGSKKYLYSRIIMDVHKTRVNVPVYLVLWC